jgi:TolB-like protein
LLVGCLVVTLGIAAWWNQGRRRALPIRSVAVLSLENLSGNPDWQYLADGMTDELIAMLAKNSTLRVVSPTSIMQYKGVHRPVREISRDLGVDGIIEGSVRRSGSKVHMTIQLIDASSDTDMWAESYDRDEAESVSLPNEVSRAIAARLKKSVTPPGPQRYIKPEAHEAYLRGRYYWFAGAGTTAFHDQAIKKAGEYYKQAVTLQPDYALAWSGLSYFYNMTSLHGDAPANDTRSLAVAAADRALELDESSGDAHIAVAENYFIYDWDWRETMLHADKAIELEPYVGDNYQFRSRVLTALNRLQEALEDQKKATELDPFGRPYGIGYMLMAMRRFDATISEMRMRLENQPSDSRLHRILSEAYWRKGMKQDAALELEKADLLESDAAGETAIRKAFENGGYQGLIRLQLNTLKSSALTEYVSPVYLADRYAQLAMKEPTLHFLEQALRERCPRLVWLQSWPAYDFLHSDARYQNIVRQIGLPPAF